MLDMLSENQVEKLRQHLIVPLAVSDILNHDLAVEPDMQYGLHMAISEIDPDSALLAIALCASEIAAKNMIHAPIAAGLYQEANNIIEEYGPTWLYHHQHGPMSSEKFEEVLDTVAEDLEALADLMDALVADLSEILPLESPTEILANLLSIQARAHMEIADFILEEIAFEKATKEHQETGEGEAPTKSLIDMDAYKGSNIVLFPGTVRTS